MDKKKDGRSERKVRVESDSQPKTLNQKLVYIRKLLKLSQAEVATNIGVSRQRYLKLEKDALPTLQEARAFVEFIDKIKPDLHLNKNIFFNDDEPITYCTNEDLKNMKLSPKAIENLSLIVETPLINTPEVNSLQVLNSFLGCSNFFLFLNSLTTSIHLATTKNSDGTITYNFDDKFFVENSLYYYEFLKVFLNEFKEEYKK